MKKLSAIIFVSFLILPLSALSQDLPEKMMERYLWQNRVLLIFTPKANNKTYNDQKKILQAQTDGLEDRDMVIWELVDQGNITIDGVTRSDLDSTPFYRRYRVDPSVFTVILLGKDGGEKLRSKQPVSETALFQLIDAMPMRQREMRQ